MPSYSTTPATNRRPAASRSFRSPRKSASFTLAAAFDDTGDLADLPGPALTLARVFTAVVAWATANPAPDGMPITNVWCWRRPGRQRCRGELVAELRPDSEIVWECPMCGVNGVIRGWEHSIWDRRQGPTDGATCEG